MTGFYFGSGILSATEATDKWLVGPLFFRRGSNGRAIAGGSPDVLEWSRCSPTNGRPLLYCTVREVRLRCSACQPGCYVS